MEKELRDKIKSVGKKISAQEARALVENDPCLALLVLQQQMTFTRTGELLVMYFGGKAKMAELAEKSGCPEIDMGILTGV